MDITTAILEECNCLKIPKWYKINADAIKTLEDVKEIIRCMDIQFNEYSELSKLPDRFKIELNNNKNNS